MNRFTVLIDTNLTKFELWIKLELEGIEVKEIMESV